MTTITPERRSVRMKRMQLILQKALDVSVHAASLVDLRACLESECRGDEELLAAFFPSTPLSPEHHSPEELAAQMVLSLRQKVETLFQWLCESHDVDKELLELEDLIQQAEERRLRQVTAEEMKTPEQEQEQEKEKEEKEMLPEERVRMERVRAKQEEQKELQKLVEELEFRNKELQKDVEEKRRVATADVHKMQRAADQLEQVSHLAKDYAAAP